MKRKRGIYLDANATVQPRSEVVEAIVSAMTSGLGNPASAHRAGAAARHEVEAARDCVASLFEGSFPEDMIFTSGGTEANNIVLRHFEDIGATFLASRTEHASILRPLERADADGRVIWIDVDSSGRVDPQSVRDGARRAPRNRKTVLAIQAANSETGVLQQVAAIVSEFRAALDNTYVLLDAAQAVGRVRLLASDLDVDAVTFSGHKLHGPQGMGALMLINPGERISPLVRGGGQEQGMRSGTLNVPGIVGFGVAAALRREKFLPEVSKLRELRDAFEERLRERLGSSVAFNGASAPRVPNTSNIRFSGVDGMRLLALLDECGVMASQGFACSSGRPEPSSTLRAMGLSSQDAFSSLRFSFSIMNDMEEALEAANIAAGIAGVIRQ
jgi:cysteine desulfurase